MSETGTRVLLFVAAVAVGVVATLALTVAASAVFGHKVVAIHSSTMEPTLSDGDIIVARQGEPADVNAGDLMTFAEPETGRTLTRRVRAIVETGDEVVFETKADSLDEVERFSLPIDGQVAEPRRRIPLVGNLGEALTGPAALLVVPLLALLGFAAIQLSRRLRRQPRP
jgi:signal peptidase